MSPYQRPPPAKDCQLVEIPQGRHRVRIVGSVVNYSSATIIVNDSSAQATLTVSGSNLRPIKVGDMGRFIAEIINENDSLSGTLVAWHPVTSEQAKRYRRLVKIERRVPKK